MSISFTNRAVFGSPMCLVGNFPIALVMDEREAGPNHRVKAPTRGSKVVFWWLWGGGGLNLIGGEPPEDSGGTEYPSRERGFGVGNL